MRQLAWLHTPPKRAEGDKSTEPVPSRLKRMQEDGVVIELPPCDAPHLIGLLFDIGPTVPAGMGMAAISHVDIQAYQQNTGADLDVWTVRTMRLLSQEYLSQSMKAESPACPPPYAEQSTPETTREAVANKLKAFFASSNVKRG